MATPAADGVRAYLATLPPDVRRAVTQLRGLIRAAAPKAVESRSYGILGYKLEGRPFVYCGGFKSHVSLYPVTAAMRRDHAEAIAPFQVSKGTLRFELDAPLPAALIKRLLKTRLAEMRAASGASRRR
jgi:uncharacterized protein YdhG (YjbR/CyaY superfamily)